MVDSRHVRDGSIAIREGQTQPLYEGEDGDLWRQLGPLETIVRCDCRLRVPFRLRSAGAFADSVLRRSASGRVSVCELERMDVAVSVVV